MRPRFRFKIFSSIFLFLVIFTTSTKSSLAATFTCFGDFIPPAQVICVLNTTNKEPGTEYQCDPIYKSAADEYCRTQMDVTDCYPAGTISQYISCSVLGPEPTPNPSNCQPKNNCGGCGVVLIDCSQIKAGVEYCCNSVGDCPAPDPNNLTPCTIDGQCQADWDGTLATIGDIRRQFDVYKNCISGSSTDPNIKVCAIVPTSSIPKPILDNTCSPFFCDINNKLTHQASDPNTGIPNGIYTAIGCIRYADINQVGTFFVKYGIGIVGGIAFILIVTSGIIILFSQGNPEKVKAGKELLNAAIAGLLMVIFSVFILKLIGVDILKLF